MSVDYEICGGCNKPAPMHNLDHECECEAAFCSLECAGFQNYEEIDYYDTENDKRLYDKWKVGNWRIDDNFPITCVICRKEKATDYMLLEALLWHLDISKEQAFEIYKTRGSK